MLLSWLRKRTVPDRCASLLTVAEVTGTDERRHVVEEYVLKHPGGLIDRVWIAVSVYAPEGERLTYSCRPCPGNGPREMRTWQRLRRARRDLERYGAVVHRRPCTHCLLGIMTSEGTPWVHTSTGSSKCPDGQGTDCNSPKSAGFGDLQDGWGGSVW